MERGSTKHGPHQDEAMAQELAECLRTGRDSHLDQRRPPEPLDDEVAEAVSSLRDGPLSGRSAEGMSAREVEERSELARWLGRAVFPAGRDEVIDHLRAQNAPDAVVASVLGVPADARFGSSGQLWRALHAGETP